jgi:Primase C terminal 2 (PriCT-2)/Bifunctional DNA primase/polymerase, N-terminal
MYSIANSGDFVNTIVPPPPKTIMAGWDEPRSLTTEMNGGSDARPSKLYDDRVRTPHRTNGAGASANGSSENDGRVALRRKLLCNGYHPVPITAPVPGEKDSGKKPLLKNWQKVCATADEAIIRSWPSKWTNTGLLCGISTEAGVLIGVDVDVLDEKLSQQIEEVAISHLGPSPLRRVGRAPKFLLAYRVEAPMAKISTQELRLPSDEVAKVEILAKGQQFVAYGVHPATGRNYEWDDARPDNTPLADLPMVTHEALKTFIDASEQLIFQAGGKGSKLTSLKSGNSGRSDKKPPKLTEGEEGRVREALKHIPADDRKVWLDVGMALHSTDWGEPARTLWEEWSRTAPEKFDEEGQHRTWESFRGERSDGITLGTLFALASRNGWAHAGEPYSEHDGATWYNTRNGGEMRLANFIARIVTDIALDDGSGLIKRRFEVMSDRFGAASVPAEQFDAMQWVTLEYGAQARIGIGRESKARLADAIKAFSHAPKRAVYAHLGWRKIDDQWSYLHAGGAIGAEGVEVQVGNELAQFVLPPVSDIKTAVRASLEMLGLAPPQITYPLWGAIYRAPLGE